MSKIYKHVKELKKNKIFWSLILFIFALHLITFPSIHHITCDEELYLNISKTICEGDFSYYTEPQARPPHGPLFPTLLCIASPIHHFNLDGAGIVSFSLLILMVIGWCFSFPESLKIDRKKFASLLFANSLLWIYSLRVLNDVPLALFLSLGMLHLYLFFKYGKRKNYYLGVIFLSLAVLTKETALIFLPTFAVYLLLKNVKNIKKFYFLIPPIVPYITLLLYQYVAGHRITAVYELIFKGISPLDYSSIPYANLPVTIYLIGTFGIGFLSVILMIKSLRKLRKEFRSFLVFFLVLYVTWEITYDFIAFASVPRWHTTLIPFFTVVISESSNVNKKMKYIYYTTLMYTLITGFLIAYCFHIGIHPI